jgi:hypothetical protein
MLNIHPRPKLPEQTALKTAKIQEQQQHFGVD